MSASRASRSHAGSAASSRSSVLLAEARASAAEASIKASVGQKLDEARMQVNCLQREQDAAVAEARLKALADAFSVDDGESMSQLDTTDKVNLLLAKSEDQLSTSINLPKDRVDTVTGDSPTKHLLVPDVDRWSLTPSISPAAEATKDTSLGLGTASGPRTVTAMRQMPKTGTCTLHQPCVQPATLMQEYELPSANMNSHNVGQAVISQPGNVHSTHKGADSPELCDSQSQALITLTVTCCSGKTLCLQSWPNLVIQLRSS